MPADKFDEPSAGQPTPLTWITGDLSANGMCIRLTFKSDLDTHTHPISIEDIQPLIVLLIALGGQAYHLHRHDVPRKLAVLQSFPAQVISLADSGENITLAFEVGPIAVGFDVPRLHVRELAENLLTMSALSGASAN